MFFRFARTCRRSKYTPKYTVSEAFWKVPGVRNVPMNKRHYVKYFVYFLLILALFGAAMGVAAFGLWVLTATGALLYFLDWIGRIGYWGNVIMVLLIILMQFPFMVGYGSTMLISGFLFGFVGGLTTLVIGCQIGLIFVGGCSRYFFREKSQEYINKNAYVQALVEELLQHKIKFSILVRLTPLPVGLQNVLLAANIPVWLYLVSSFFGMLIEQIPMVYIGTTAKNLAEILAGGGDLNPVEFLVIGISGAGILIVGIVLFWVSRKALKKVKQRQAEMETETAEEGEEALDLEELYDAEDADTVLDLDLGVDEEEWEELEMKMTLGVASYAGSQPELEKGSYGMVEESVKLADQHEVLLHTVSSGEHLSDLESHSAMITVSSGEHLAELDSSGMVVEQVLPVECGDDLGEMELAVVDSVKRRNASSTAGESTSDADSSYELENGIGLTPPRSRGARKSSTEVKAELELLRESDSSENVAKPFEGFSTEHGGGQLLDDLEMFGSDDDTEAMLDDEVKEAPIGKKGPLKKLQHAMKPLSKKLAPPSRRESQASLVSDLTEDQDLV